MTNQMDNLSRLINKYSNRFGPQDLLVLDLKKELTNLHLKQSEFKYELQNGLTRRETPRGVS